MLSFITIFTLCMWFPRIAIDFVFVLDIVILYFLAIFSSVYNNTIAIMPSDLFKEVFRGYENYFSGVTATCTHTVCASYVVVAVGRCVTSQVCWMLFYVTWLFFPARRLKFSAVYKAFGISQQAVTVD